MSDEHDADCSSNNNSNNSDHSHSTSPGLRFDGVELYFFRRKQGFNCVPSRGGTTLGMAEKHFHSYRLSFDGSHGDGEEVIETECSNLSFDNNSNQIEPEDEPEEQPSLKPPIFSDKTSLAELRPLPVRQRRRLLRLSGVKRIDTTERFECEAIRTSRVDCGCQCGPICLPDTCSCIVNGIACQVDKLGYPCSCEVDRCHNPEGRVEFNAIRVRRHLIHTLNKLYSNEQQSEDSGAIEDDDEGNQDNCDDHGRCRHCNIEEPTVLRIKRSTLELCEDSLESDSGKPSRGIPLPRQTSAAIIATKMLRKRLAKQWKQKAMQKSPSNRLMLMRRAMMKSGTNGEVQSEER